MSTRNRLGNAHNPFQGDFKRVLCVCTAGLLRSPTAAVVLSQEPYNFNTRAVGTSDEFALIPIEEVHLEWANEVVCMSEAEELYVKTLCKECDIHPKIICLHIHDDYSYRDPELIEFIKNGYEINR